MLGIWASKLVALPLFVLAGLLAANPEETPSGGRLAHPADSSARIFDDEPRPESPSLPESVIEEEGADDVADADADDESLLKSVTYTGNRKFNAARLAVETGLKAGSLYDLAANREAVEKLTSLYRSRGYLYATVELAEGNRLDDREVVFQIDEGPKVVLTKIEFEGNRSVPAWVLRLQVPAATEIPLLTEGLHDPEKVPGYVVALKQFYRHLGYFDVAVMLRETTSENRARVALHFLITEGDRYRIRQVTFAGNQVVPDGTLRELTNAREDASYDQRVVTADRKRIEAHYRARGRIYAHIETEAKRSAEPRAVDLRYIVEEDEVYGIVRRPGPPDANSPTGLKSPRRPSLATQTPARTGESDDIREIASIAFAGVKAFDLADVRDALAHDFDVNLAAHPDVDLFTYLEALEAGMVKGYRHRGFPDAEAAVAYNSTRKRIEITVQEGRRYRCGDLRISGTRRVSAEGLLRALTENSDPSRIAWKKGGPAPFDGERDDRIRECIRAEFAAAGYFCPDLDVHVHPDERSGLVELEVTVRDKGLPARVGRVVVTGTKRDSADDVLKYLHLSAGDPYDSGLISRLERQLSASGRFLSVRIDERDPAADADELEPRQALRIQLREYRQAPPLAQALSPAEQALLRLGEWIEHWSQGEADEDLVVHLEIGPEAFMEVWSALKDSVSESARPLGALLGDARLSISLILSPRHGQTISLRAAHAKEAPLVDLVFAAYPDRIVLADLQRRAKLELRNSAKRRLTFSLSGRAMSAEEEKEAEGKSFRLGFWMGMSQRSQPYPAPFEVSADFLPAFMLSLVHDESARAELADGACKLVTDSFGLEFDAASGRLREIRSRGDSPAAFTIRMEKNALQTEFAKLAEPLEVSISPYDATSPCKSVMELFVDECVTGAESLGFAGQTASLRALRKLLAVWVPPGIEECWNPKADFARPDDPFSLPAPSSPISYEGLFQPQSPTRKFVTGHLLAAYRRLVPKTGWLWPAGRDAALYWAAEHDEPGWNLGELFSASLDWQLRARLERRGASPESPPLDARGFADLCRPFLSDDSWMGKWCLSLASAAGRLDESELHALARFLPDNAPRQAIVECLASLKTGADQPAPGGLGVALDRLWANVVRPHVESVFGESFVPANHRRPNLILDDRVLPAGTEETPEFHLEIDVPPKLEPVPRFSLEPEVAPEPSAAAHPESKRERKAAASVKPGAPVLLALAKFHEQRGHCAAARAVYEQLLAADANSIDAIVGLAGLALSAGRTAAARAAYERAVRIDPTSPAALDALGQFYGDQTEWDEALVLFQRAMTAAPDDKTIRFHYGIALAQTGKIDDAFAQLQESVGTAAAHYNVGVVLHGRGDRAGSEEQFREAITANPKLEQARHWLRKVRRERDKQGAGDDPQTASVADGDDPMSSRPSP